MVDGSLINRFDRHFSLLLLTYACGHLREISAKFGSRELLHAVYNYNTSVIRWHSLIFMHAMCVAYDYTPSTNACFPLVVTEPCFFIKSLESGFLSEPLKVPFNSVSRRGTLSCGRGRDRTLSLSHTHTRARSLVLVLPQPELASYVASLEWQHQSIRPGLLVI